MARSIIDSNRYMVLGTVDPDGRPRVSPVYFAPDGYDTMFWISSPASHHSRNIAERPEISVVIFDSGVPVGGGAQAVYLLATAARVPDEELDRHVETACRARFPEQEPFPAEELRPPAELRLYRARVTEHSVHIRGSDPVHGKGVDSRLVVDLGGLG
ncbi:pyridoxamine 5'-phosphate oxidase family protein [Nonomuraea sp. PA05]|uniref:pyridoxamine 5'-phosphate oxidase family protein n=1 Tax=Nonomuraea sp. PA05 TaxID=2604466 RepID=UPI0011D91024|nr:pyridoxamine 5'-phosphate oxidase family protein [Nonomuraea sp. PA05]TYB66167.1 pyridoxamine 5'-phosphate oxidase family protein [Nonomuraea sp. PA05]